MGRTSESRDNNMKEAKKTIKTRGEWGNKLNFNKSNKLNNTTHNNFNNIRYNSSTIQSRDNQRR